MGAKDDEDEDTDNKDTHESSGTAMQATSVENMSTETWKLKEQGLKNTSRGKAVIPHCGGGEKHHPHGAGEAHIPRRYVGALVVRQKRVGPFAHVHAIGRGEDEQQEELEEGDECVRIENCAQREVLRNQKEQTNTHTHM